MTDSFAAKAAPAEESVYYHNDIFGSKILVDIFARNLGDRVLEVGAGAGYVTMELAKHAREVVAIEPHPVLVAELRERTRHLSNVTVFNVSLAQFISQEKARTEIAVNGTYDSVVYINVLEHIEDDHAELSQAGSVLSAGGRVLIVVPAHQWLYAKVDRLSGHFRRYSKAALSRLLDDAGLNELSLRYFDTIGILPYLVMYKWLGSKATTGANATVYSRLILPVSYILHRLSGGRIIGKNLIAVAQAAKSAS